MVVISGAQTHHYPPPPPLRGKPMSKTDFGLRKGGFDEKLTQGHSSAVCFSTLQWLVPIGEVWLSGSDARVQPVPRITRYCTFGREGSAVCKSAKKVQNGTLSISRITTSHSAFVSHGQKAQQNGTFCTVWSRVSSLKHEMKGLKTMRPDTCSYNTPLKGGIVEAKVEGQAKMKNLQKRVP